MARQAALDALKSDAAAEPSIGLIFYPGGHVDYRAYTPIPHSIAANGILVVLVPVRLNLAFFDIDGGNHGQFADYGPQPGDNRATISAPDQWDQTSAATVAFLNSLRC